jgi:hypothetical protein
MSTITALPTPPSRSNPTTFSVLADSFLAALPTFVSETNVISADISSKIDTTIAQANAALAAVNAVMWTSKVYAVGDVAWSPINKQSYRCLTAGTRSTDPANDAANWEVVSTRPEHPVETRSTSSTLGVADRSKFLYCAAGFTQYFSPAATLGDGWFVIIQNGTAAAAVTIDPYTTELSDGLRSFVMYPGETRLFFCDGTGLSSIVLSPFLAVYSASNTFTKPPGYSLFSGLIWGGGSPGGRGSVSQYGGGGGSCASFAKRSSDVAATESVVVGSSTTGRTTDGAPPAGSDSSFLGFTAKGGVGGAGGLGGKAYDLGPAAGNAITGGGAAFTLYGGASSNDGSATIGTIYGGGGGGTTANTAATPTIFGGAGGAGTSSTNGGDGTAPGGGGGATTSGTKSGDGARGEVWVWGIV